VPTTSGCGTIPKCYLVNLKTNGERHVFTATGKEIVPNGAATEYTPADAGTSGWSIMCKEQGKDDFVK
jgi:hypothetical protein